MSQNAMLVARKPSCRDASAFLTKLKLIWPRSSLNTPKCPRNTFFTKSSGSQWVKGIDRKKIDTRKCVVLELVHFRLRPLNRILVILTGFIFIISEDMSYLSSGADDPQNCHCLSHENLSLC